MTWATLASRALRLLPAWLAQSVYYRVFRRISGRAPEVFRGSRLRYAPNAQMDLVPGDECHGAIAFTGVYELLTTRRVLRASRAGGILVDVGANYGYFSMLWAGQGQSCQALAFEPSPRVFPGLVENSRHPSVAPRITCHQIAVSCRPGILNFAVGPPGQSGWGRISDAGENEVSADTLDAQIQGGAQVAVLKIDAEGHDFSVLLGAADLISRRGIREIIWEADTGNLESAEALNAFQLLRKAGYTWRPLDRSAKGLTVFVAELTSPRA